MKHAAWINMVRQGAVNVTCSICGDLRKACYRCRYRGYPDYVFVVIPCHGCNGPLFRQHPLYKANLELTDTWRNQNDLAEKLRADEKIRAAEQLAPAPRPLDQETFRRMRDDLIRRATNPFLYAQDTTEPPQSNPGN